MRHESAGSCLHLLICGSRGIEGCKEILATKNLIIVWRFGTTFDRRGPDDVCGKDQGEMRERLRKVADVALQLCVLFLGQKPQVITQSEKPFEQFFSFRQAASQGVVVDQPESAREECALFPWQAVGTVLGVVA